MDAEVAVVGAGLAGLTAARRLAEADAEVTVYEREPQVGGRVGSRDVDGFTVDNGFQVLFTGYSMVQRELDLDALDLRRYRSGAVVCRDGRRSVFSDPSRDPGAAYSSLRNPEFTVGDKLRLATLYARLRFRDPDTFFQEDDTSIRSYVESQGFSTGFVEGFVRPFFAGITLDPGLSTSSHVFRYCMNALARGYAAVPAEGMQMVPRQIADQASAAGASIQTSAEVEGVEAREEGGEVEVEFEDGGTRVFDAVVVATSPPDARELSGVQEVPTDGVGGVTQCCSLEDPLESGRRLLLNAEDTGPAVVAPSSEVAPEYGDGDRYLVAASYPGADAAERGAAELRRETVAALEAWYPEKTFGNVDVVATDRYRFAQYSQPPGFQGSLPDVDSPDSDRLFLAGDFTEWSSIQGALASGRTAAEVVEKQLDSK